MTIKADIARLVLQEQRLRFTSFSEDDAWRLGCAMRDLAVSRKLPLVIDIRVAGRQLFYCALEGSHGDNPHWVRRKSNVTLRVFKSSYRFGRELVQKGESVGGGIGLDPMEFAPHGGSFPIHVEGTGFIGAVTVSGIPQRDDHGFVVEALCEFLGQPHDELKLGPETAE